MSSTEHKLIHIAQVLASMPEAARLLVVLEILPSSFVLAPRQVSPGIQDAFHTTAKRLHEGLKTKLAFESSVLPPCWRAMIERAEREVELTAASNYTHGIKQKAG
jgi:hypothetical protein